MSDDAHHYQLAHRKQESFDVVTLSFIPMEGKVFEYSAGQYIYVDLIENPKKFTSRPYSISSAPHQDCISVSVKKIGVFSTTLHELSVGSKVLLRGPVGNFVPSLQMKKMVFIAGGIGIAPFVSILNSFRHKKVDPDVVLFYSNKEQKDIAFQSFLSEMASSGKGLRLVNMLTQQAEKCMDVHEYRRFDAQMLAQYCPIVEGREFYICGSVAFVTETSKTLEEVGVPYGNIHAELFY